MINYGTRSIYQLGESLGIALPTVFVRSNELTRADKVILFQNKDNELILKIERAEQNESTTKQTL